MSLCINRLQEERKQWRKDHPFGFYAKPARGANGVTDLKVWEVGIPGRSGTIWAGGLFRLTITFPDEYPTKPPKCESWQRALAGRPTTDNRRQIYTTSIPPERVSFRHSLSLDSERGGRLETSDHHQADSSRHPGPAQRSQSRVPSSGRGIQPLQEGPGRV